MPIIRSIEEIEKEIETRIKQGREDIKETKSYPNSYAAGFNNGYNYALTTFLEWAKDPDKDGFGEEAIYASKRTETK